MRRLPPVWTALVAVVAVMAVGLGVLAYQVAPWAGPSGDVEASLLVLEPGSMKVGAIAADQWKVYQRDETDQNATYEWSAPGGVLVHESVQKRGNALTAWYNGISEDEKRRYEKQFPGLTRNLGAPSDISSRFGDLFCGNVGRPTSDRLESCQIWGYRERFGRYLVYLEVSGAAIDSGAFVDLVRTYRSHLRAVLEPAAK